MKRFALTFLMAAIAAVVSTAAIANPKGIRDEDLDKLVWNGTAHAKPGYINPDLNCNGHRLFFELSNGNTIGYITWEFDETPEYANGNNVVLVDCVGPNTLFEVAQSFEVVIYVVLRGPRTSTLNLVCENQIVDDDLEDLCEVGSANLTRGNGMDTVRLTKNLAEDDFEEVLWTFDGDWRVFQIKVYSLK